ncbi:MAG TPA: endonuclease/exonuclease/phosphatase family protein [Pyrinomonadaceae bacterium]|nr:endonuclease/exonuclease/phosphatase family protein [Pyrinomonadaceae bacterium]
MTRRTDKARARLKRLLICVACATTLCAARDAGDAAPRGATYPADKPVKRIDYVFHTSRLRARRAWVVESLASDHRAVVSELEFKD